jgi:hypothetical protein
VVKCFDLSMTTCGCNPHQAYPLARGSKKEPPRK